MQLNKTTEYAVRALVYLERNKGLQRLEDIAREMDIPEGYLIKVMRRLRAHRFIETRQGVKGGYRLGQPAGQISLYGIFAVTEKTMKINQCLEDGMCALTGKESGCRTGAHQIYCELQDIFEEKLKSVTLEDLARGF